MAIFVSRGLVEFLSRQMMTCSQWSTSSAYSSRETKASLLPLHSCSVETPGKEKKGQNVWNFWNDLKLQRKKKKQSLIEDNQKNAKRVSNFKSASRIDRRPTIPDSEPSLRLRHEAKQTPRLSKVQKSRKARFQNYHIKGKVNFFKNLARIIYDRKSRLCKNLCDAVAWEKIEWEPNIETISVEPKDPTFNPQPLSNLWRDSFKSLTKTTVIEYI